MRLNEEHHLKPDALKQLEEWKKSDREIVLKIIALITEISTTPFTGTGKPEPLNTGWFMK